MVNQILQHNQIACNSELMQSSIYVQSLQSSGIIKYAHESRQSLYKTVIYMLELQILAPFSTEVP